jgi:peptidoglycan hydrolase CwlO-like protein
MTGAIESISEGVTPEFYWYELTNAKAKLQEVQQAVDKVLKTLEARQKEQDDYVFYLRSKLDRLQVEVNALRKE